MTIRSISYGGGVQSTAMIVLATQGRIDADVALFANVGDDSEHPATLVYVRDVMIPWAAERGLPIHELRRTRKGGELFRGLYGDIVEHDTPGKLREPIPIRGMNGMPLSRSCTRDWKVGVVGRWLKDNGASAVDPATVYIGISTDEIQRVGNKKVGAYERPTYPLIDLGLSRAQCMTIIAEAGLPVPPKSACWFCPFHTKAAWAEQRRDEPDLFEKAAGLEDLMNARRRELDKDPVFLTYTGIPLREAITEAQDMLPGFDHVETGEVCDEGYCWT